MGIHASDNVSHLAHQVEEPSVPELYDYDDFIIMAPSGAVLAKFTGTECWYRARTRFLHYYNVEKEPVKLLGRVYN